MYLFFRYYSTGGTKHIPYFSALSAVVFSIYIHVFQILTIIKKVDVLLPFKRDDSRGMLYWKAILLFVPIYLIVGYLVKPKDLKNLVYDEEKIKHGGIFLVIYCIMNVILLFVLMLAIPQAYN